MRRSNRITGFTLVEALISVALVSALLGAVGVAMHASVTSYNENDESAAMTQEARTVLNRMTTDIRNADSLAVSADNKTLTIFVIVPNAQNLQQIVYQVQANGNLNMTRVLASGSKTYTVLDATSTTRLTAISLTPTMGTDADNVACTKSVTVTLTLQSGPRTFSLVASSDPRRNQIF